MNDNALLALVVVGVLLGAGLFVYWLPLLSEQVRLRRQRQQIERRVANRTVVQPEKKPLLTFGCLMKWLAALGLASWSAALAAVAVYVIVILVVLLVVLAMVGIWGCFAASFIASMHP